MTGNVANGTAGVSKGENGFDFDTTVNIAIWSNFVGNIVLVFDIL